MQRIEDAALAKLNPQEIKTERQICNSTLSKVYLGFFNQQRVVIKVVKPHINEMGIDVGAKCFRNEQAAFRKLSAHNALNLVKCLGYIETELTCKLVLEFCDNGALDLIMLNERPWSWQMRYNLIVEIVGAVWFLHETVKILHNDIKSANVFITVDNHAKLGDFGFARSADETPRSQSGTTHFMAPEVSTSGHTYATNIFALGVCLWEIKEWKGPTFPKKDAKKRIANGEREQIGAEPAKLTQLIQTMWAQAPEKRPSISSVQQEVNSQEFKQHLLSQPAVSVNTANAVVNKNPSLKSFATTNRFEALNAASTAKPNFKS